MPRVVHALRKLSSQRNISTKKMLGPRGFINACYTVVRERVIQILLRLLRERE